MKNLANCTPREFMAQTNRIRKSVEKWLTDTDIMNIRRRMPEGLPVAVDASDTDAIMKRNELLRKQAHKNFSAILDAVMEDHPEETLDILALCCFVEPEEIESYSVSDFLMAFFDMIEDEAVMRFFTLLGRLGLMPTSED